MCALYKPISISQFWGNKNVIDSVDNFLQHQERQQEQQHEKDFKTNCCILVGRTGSGKTTLVKLLHKKYDRTYSIFRPQYDQYPTHKDFSASVLNYLRSRTIEEIMGKKDKILFLDDIEIILSINRYANAFFLDILSELKNTNHKVIITCTRSMEKKLSELKKKSLVLYIYNPPPYDIVQYILSLQDYGTKLSESEILEFVLNNDCNFRSIMMGIDTLLAAKTLNKNIKSHTLAAQMQPKQKSSGITSSLNFDQSLSDITYNIMMAPKPYSIKDIKQWISTDSSLMSYMLYENAVKNCNVDVEKLLKVYSDASLMEYFVFAYNDWFLHDLCNLWRCATAKECILPLSSSNSTFERSKIQYTSTPTKSSNYFYTVKKNAISVSDLYLSRSDVVKLSEVSGSCIKLDGTSILTKKVLEPS